MTDNTEEGTTGPVRTVLYVEDNLANLRLIAQLIKRRANLRMIAAHEPQLGLDLAAAHHPDLILLDINLPDMDGYEVLKRLRANPALANTPVLAISANATPCDVARGMAAGFADYLTKPIDIQRFYAALDAALGPD